MRERISGRWRRVVWSLAGLALLAWPLPAGAQTSRRHGRTGRRQRRLGHSGGGGLSGGGGASGGGGVSGGTGLSGGSTTFSGGAALQGGLGNSNSVSGASASTYTPNSGGSIGRTGLMGSYYSNPYAMGLTYSGMTQNTFGQPVYNLQSLTGSALDRLGRRSGHTGRLRLRRHRRCVGQPGWRRWWRWRQPPGARRFRRWVGPERRHGNGNLLHRPARLKLLPCRRLQPADADPADGADRHPADHRPLVAIALAGQHSGANRRDNGGPCGNVASEHERAVAELTARLTPGVLSLTTSCKYVRRRDLPRHHRNSPASGGTCPRRSPRLATNNSLWNRDAVHTLMLTERCRSEHTLSGDDLDFLQAEHAHHLRIDPTRQPSRYRLTPTRCVGLLVAPTCRLVIQPKIPLRSLFHLLTRTALNPRSAP